MTKVVGCEIKSLDGEECRQIIDAVTAGSPIASQTAGTCWLLAYCDDGVVWGRRDDDSSGWSLSNGPFPEISPTIGEVNLQELRLFGPDADLLIWRGDGGFRGRRLSDDGSAAPGGPTAPADEVRILLGNRVLEGPRDGFTVVGDETGSRHAVPFSCSEDEFSGRRMPLRLRVRHYFSQDPDIGVVHVAATRLISLEKERQA